MAVTLNGHARVPKTLRALGIGFFRIFRVIASGSVPTWWGLVRSLPLTLLTASSRERTLPRLLVMAKLTLSYFFYKITRKYLQKVKFMLN